MTQLTVLAPKGFIILGDYTATNLQSALLVASNFFIQTQIKANNLSKIIIKANEFSYTRGVEEFKDITKIPAAIRILDVCLQIFYATYQLKQGVTIFLSDQKQLFESTVACLWGINHLLNLNLKKKSILEILKQAFGELKQTRGLAQAIISLFGGIIYLDLQENLKIEPLSFNQNINFTFFQIKSSPFNSSKNLKQMLAKHQQEIEKEFKLMDILTKEAKDSFSQGKFLTFGKIVNVQQKQLNDLSLSCQFHHDLCVQANLKGGLGAKTIGKNYVLVLGSKQFDSTNLINQTSQIFSDKIDQKGVRINNEI
ncbi:hypothetical protein GYA19_04620 [Candidatus Beckwithbacteria bacterium]|nr:hypothetical protein [Candidatus Beckwithbacteria bacterium]